MAAADAGSQHPDPQRRDPDVRQFPAPDRTPGFFNASLKEIDFPALDAASHDAGLFTVTIQTEQIRPSAPTAAAPTSTKPRSPWRVSNFRVAVDAVDTSTVSTIDALAVKQTITRDFRGGIVEVAVTDPDLVMTQPGAGTFAPWANDFLVQGNHLDANERSGSLTMLAPNLKDELFTLSFGHLGVVGLGSAGPEQAGAPIATRVQLYMEDLQFSFTPTW